MKTVRRSLAACLMLCALLTLLTVGVFAEEAQDGLTVTLTTDKEAYGAGETVTAVLTVTNTNNVPMQSVTLKQLVPEGYELAEGQTDTKAVVDLGAGESVSLTVIWAPAAETQDTGFSLMKFYQNNKTLVHIVGIVLGVILLVVLVAFGIHKLRYAFISMLLCSVMLFGAVSGTVVQVQALEPVEGSIKTSVSFTADGQEKKLEAVVEYSMEPEETPEAICTVTFDTLGGSAVESQQVENGGLAVRPDVPTREGHVFVGWYADAEFENLFDFAAPITKSCTVYAYWINTEDETDTDGDGLTDELERYFGTDKEKVDTDGDGLSDYVEVMVLNYDPLKTDTDENGTTDDREDLDQDGLDNKTEIELGTDCFIADTDQDALTDKDEVETHHTDPLKSDTDGDGFLDGWEIENGTDPLSENKTLDVTETVEMLDVTATLDIHLNGEQQQSLTVENSDDSIFMNTVPGQISSALSLTMDGELPESGATLSFAVGEEFPQEVTEDFVPVIYYYNPETFLLEEVPTTYVNGVATTHLTHFSTYILLNKVLFDEVWETEIKPPDTESSGKNGVDVVFVVDSSGSMSSNDRQNIRITAVKNFIDKLGENDRAAVVDFDSKATLYQSFTGDHDALYNAINRVNASGNTNLSNGMSLALQQFMDGSYTRTDAFKYIIFLTDGQGNYSTSYTQTAADNGIVIYTVGLGSGVDANVLKGMANGTGGKYYFASEADDLIEIYDKAIEETIDYSTDSNDDKISDYYTKLLCEGKLVNGVGQNYFVDIVTPELRKEYPELSDSEIAFNVIQANRDYDGDGLLNGQEVIIRKEEYVKEGKTYFKVYTQVYSDPTKTDSDGDAASDKDEKESGTNPLVQDMDNESIDYVCQGQYYYAEEMAKQYIQNGALQVAVRTGNLLLGGDLIFTKVAEKELMNVIEAYLGENYESLKDQIVKSIWNQIYKGTMDAVSFVLQIGLPETLKWEIIVESEKLGKMYYQFIEAPSPNLSADELKKGQKAIEKATKSVYKKVEEAAEFKNMSIKLPNTVHLPVPKFLDAKKLADGFNKVIGKIGRASVVVSKGVKYISLGYTALMAIGSIVDTVNAYGALFSCDIENDIIDEFLLEVALKSEIPWVKNAATMLARYLLDNRTALRYAIEGTSIVAGVVNEVDEIAISGIITKLGPVGWALEILRMYASITGVGDFYSDIVHVIALGEAGKYSGALIYDSVASRDGHVSVLGRDTIKYYRLGCYSRLFGEKYAKTMFRDQGRIPDWMTDSDYDFSEEELKEITDRCDQWVNALDGAIKYYENYQDPLTLK